MIIAFKQFLVNVYYKVRQKLGNVTFSQSIQIVSPEKTLIKISECIEKQQIGAYLRFGDGEINMIEGRGAMEQEPNKKLAHEMREAFEVHSDTILKSLMIHSNKFGRSEGMELGGMHLLEDSFAEQLLFRSYVYFIGEPIYSHVAFAYSAVFAQEAFLQTLKKIKLHDTIFIGNKNISEKLIKDIFGNDIQTIKTESKNTYSSIERINKELITEVLKNNNSYKIVIYAAGPTSNILQKRAIERSDNTFSIDIGSLIDAFAGNVSRAWIEKVPGGKSYWTDLLSKINTSK